MPRTILVRALAPASCLPSALQRARMQPYARCSGSTIARVYRGELVSYASYVAVVDAARACGLALPPPIAPASICTQSRLEAARGGSSS